MQKESPKSEIEQYVIKRVKEIRIEKGVSQAKLAHLIDLSVGFVGNVENPKHIAKWNLNHLEKIAKVLGVSMREFLPL
ncbi:helix-turn-helix transcriptional regulator [Sphingobacterium daejeonense]|uniref:helix-turn-helix domain-containing protein n=1 Tax=Sphingobacterium daejeonense TaxID=371142 RepID=UPI0021A2ABA8|nr:helix-turn-helix transcriptional regulator [Sphingobacterium daejeonense]MCT1529964.1 helix-turn-helix transcriptional regulator [Sphingobacterium daejeonense]